MLQLSAYTQCANGRYRFDMTQKRVVTIDSEEVYDTVSYARMGGGIILVLPPTKAFVREHV